MEGDDRRRQAHGTGWHGDRRRKARPLELHVDQCDPRHVVRRPGYAVASLVHEDAADPDRHRRQDACVLRPGSARADAAVEGHPRRALGTLQGELRHGEQPDRVAIGHAAVRRAYRQHDERPRRADLAAVGTAVVLPVVGQFVQPVRRARRLRRDRHQPDRRQPVHRSGEEPDLRSRRPMGRAVGIADQGRDLPQRKKPMAA
jgi:hypothetical protein